MTEYAVTLEWPDGRTETIDVPESESVLDAAQRNGVRLPSDCRKGTCITCVGQVLEVEDEGADSDIDGGDGSARPSSADAFTYRRSPAALTDGEQADGYVLLCIAAPRADCRVRVGPRVRSEVGDSPWS